MAGMFSKVSGAFSHKDPAERVKQGDQEGDSLLTVLPSDEDRGNLTLLIADCTERMRKSIVDVFDPTQTGKDEEMVLKLEGMALRGEEANAEADAKLAEAEQAAKEGSSGEEVKKGEKEMAKRGKEVEKDAQKQEKEASKREKELEKRSKALSGPKMQELKDEALKHFDEWRDQVITRVGEVVNSKEKARSQEKSAGRKVDDERPPLPARPAKMPDYDEAIFETTNRLYPPIDTPLKDFPQEKRMLILHSVLLLMLSLEHYQSYSRTLLLRLTNSLDLHISVLTQDESKVAQGLLAAVSENMNADEETKKKAEENSTKRKWTVGLATVGGAALIGITGGLAAPLLAAGVGTVMGGIGLGATATAGYLGAIAGSSVLVGGLFGAYGGRMTGKMMDQYARQVEDFAFIPVRAQHLRQSKNDMENRRLRVGIGISGWLTSKAEVLEPWKVLGSELEDFALRWELEALLNLGNSLTTMVKSAAWSYAKSEIVKRTVFGALSAGLWPLALLKVSRVIDNPWSVASYRAQKAGEVLAEALINKVQGERPVTLVGYSLGAKVIYTCLHRLAERHAFGLVENAVLIGSPVPSDSADWRLLRTVISGRLVNVYSTKDYILGFLYRSSNFQFGVAGLQRIENVAGVENVDVSEHVEGHTSYRLLTGTILKKIGFEDIDVDEVAREENVRRQQEAKEEEERQEAEKQGGDQQDIEALEAEVEKKNQQSFGGWTREKLSRAKDSWDSKQEQWKERKSAEKQRAEVEKRVDAHNNVQGKEGGKDLGGTMGGFAASGASLP